MGDYKGYYNGQMSLGDASRVKFIDNGYERSDYYENHYSKNYWIRAMIETLVKLWNLKSPIVTLIDHVLEINLISKKLYDEKNSQLIPIMDGSFKWQITHAESCLEFI